MKSLRLPAAIILLLILALAAYGWWQTTPSTEARMAQRSAPGAPPVVDRSPLETANRLLPLAASVAERDLAEKAVAAADHLLDLDFAAALHEATEHPAPLTAEAKAAQARLDSAAERLIADTGEIARLSEAVSTAKRERADVLEGQRALAQVQFEIDQDAFTQAGKDLIAAGGDLRGRIQSLVAEHRSAVPNAAPLVAPLAPAVGLIHLVPHWLALRRTDRAIATARDQTQRVGIELATAEGRLRSRIQSESAHAASLATVNTSAERAARQLANAKAVAADQKRVASLDERSMAVRTLREIYEQWLALSTLRTTQALHQMLPPVVLIVVACLLLLFFDGWLRLAFDRLHLDRRQAETLHTVTTVTLQITAVLFIALVIVGPPGQLGTFLGLAGAGLTVALKDFIVAFIGWLVLMGKNGIRLGDWVEIEGVSGEVVELGMFHTMLSETGNWTDPGHPTGRRVTFTNSFAIQGHYFNFSTTGQWLWDELKLVVPAGQDLYAVVGSITQIVKDATAEDGRLAEEEWKKTTPTRKAAAPSAEPSVNVKPVVGGTEVSLRYITRAGDRYRLRASLYQSAVDLLGGKHAPAVELTSGSTAPPLAGKPA